MIWNTKGIIFLWLPDCPPLSDQEFKQPICVPEHLVTACWGNAGFTSWLVVKSWWGARGALVMAGGLGDGAHKPQGLWAACQLWDLALPAPACCCASSSQAGLLIGCCVSLCSAGTEVVLESEMAGIWPRCTEAGLRSLQENFTYLLMESRPVTGFGFVEHNDFALAQVDNYSVSIWECSWSNSLRLRGRTWELVAFLAEMLPLQLCWGLGLCENFDLIWCKIRMTV